MHLKFNLQQLQIAESVEKYNMDDALFIEKMSTVTEELEDYKDHKVLVSETSINTSCTDLKDHVKDEILGHFETSTFVDNIKTEPSEEASGNFINSIVDVKDEVAASADVKIEFDNGFLFCDHCQAYYKDFCTKCGMLVHILNAEDRGGEEIPSNILEIRDSFKRIGVFALKVIPADVKFGPVGGLSTSDINWKLKDGKFVVNKDSSTFSHWMQYINPARNISERNLLVFQCDGSLYYRSVREIQTGEELLAHFGQEYEDGLSTDAEMDFNPPVEESSADVFACTLCCLGFSSRLYLAKHKHVCPNRSSENFSTEELVQCQYCKIYLDEKVYLECHMAYCCDRNNRKCIPTVLENQMIQAKRSKTRRLQMYKCNRCSYRTTYRSDLKSHANRHYEVKMYKCAICYNKRFKTEDSLEMHMKNMHVKVEENKTQKYSTNNYETSNSKARVSELRTKTKRKHLKNYKCSICEFKVGRRYYLENHMKKEHRNEFMYKCGSCHYKTNSRDSLKRHKKTKHLKEFDYTCEVCACKTNWKKHIAFHVKYYHVKDFNYKCELCGYNTFWKGNLNNHMKAKHLKKCDYECEMCEYKSNYKCDFENHVKTKHLKEFDYVCEVCEYKTNRKPLFSRHVKTRHLKELKYRCEMCEFKTNWKGSLNLHVKSYHIKELEHKCEICDYKTNHKSYLEYHIKTKHLKEFDYECETCDYKTNHKRNFNNHVKTKHLKEFNYKCATCDYQTNQKKNLVCHIKTKHLKEFKYKCEQCEYKSNHKRCFDSHIKAIHLKEFKYECELCDYKTNHRSDLEKHLKGKTHPKI